MGSRVLPAGLLLLLTLPVSTVVAQIVYLQNDGYVQGDPIDCVTGIGDSESLAAKFTAASARTSFGFNSVS